MDLFGFLGSLGDAIGGQLSSIVDWATAGFGTLFGDIVSVGGVLTSFIDWVKGAIGSIVSFLGGLWQWLRDSILTKIINWIRRAYEWLHNLLAPLIRWIQMERALLYQLWNTYVKPIMDFIQRLRRALLIFRLLGFKWAQELDAYLVKLENKINRAFLGAFQNLNILADWINWITDPFGLWSSNVWLGAIAQSVGAIWSLIWGAPQVGLGGPGLATFDTPAGYYDASAVQARLAARFSVGELPDDQAVLQGIRADNAESGYSPVLV
jgi:hypothetical protein